MTPRGASKSPAGNAAVPEEGAFPRPLSTAAAAATGSKAGKGSLRTRAPQTRPAPPGHPTGALAAPTARLILPADSPAADWHAARAAGIGGSDVAAIVGLSRWKSPLHVWLEKQGRSDFVDSEAAECGRELEATILRLFSRRSGLPVLPGPGTLAHVDRPWMHANLDGLAAEPDGTPAPVEAKNRSEHQARDWADDIPDEPALQAMWYLAVTGYAHAYVAALIGGNRLRWHRLDRDDELIEHLVAYCGRWWQRHVIEGVQPPADGSRATTELLAHLWDVRPEAVIEVDPVTTAGLLHRRRELKAGIAELDAELDLVENQLKAMCGEAEVAAVGGRTVFTWKANSTFRQTDFRMEQSELAARYVRQVDHVDTDRLAADHPDIHRRYRARRLFVPEEGPLS
jgi:putative phage-type endonuclease